MSYLKLLKQFWEFKWSKGFRRELNCQGFRFTRLTSTVMNVLFVIKLASDIIMYPLCWTLYPNIIDMWGSALAFYSFSLAVANDINIIIVKATSVSKTNELPYALVGTLLTTEICLLAYDGVFFMNAHAFSVKNGVVFTLCGLHVSLRVIILISLKRCPVVRLIKDNVVQIVHDPEERVRGLGSYEQSGRRHRGHGRHAHDWSRRK